AWTFLGLSIPAWTLVAFAGLAIGWLLQLRSQAPRI
ncbi:MAG: disulfide bond formation protein B, partial [Pseudomonadales bacterium]